MSNNPTCIPIFQELRKVKEKALRYYYHLDNYMFYTLGLTRFVYMSNLIHPFLFSLPISHETLEPSSTQYFHQPYPCINQTLWMLSWYFQDIFLMQNPSQVAQLLAMTSSWVKLRLVSQDLNLLSVPEEIIWLVTCYTNRNYTWKDGLDNLINPRRNLQFRTPLSLTYLPLLCLSQKRNCSPRVSTSAQPPQKLTRLKSVNTSLSTTVDFVNASFSWTCPRLTPSLSAARVLGHPQNRSPSLETYIQVVSSKINSSDYSLHRTHDNLSREQRERLASAPVRFGFGGAISMTYSSFGPVMKRV